MEPIFGSGHNANLEVLAMLPVAGCNMRPLCPYCYVGNPKKDPCGTDMFISGMMNLVKRFSPIRFNISANGEPFTVDERILSMFATLSDSNWVYFTSNLVADDDRYQIFDRSPVVIQLSYHPHRWGMGNEEGTKAFCDKINRLRKTSAVKFEYTSLVGYPLYFPFMKKALAMIHELTGINTTTLEYHGSYAGLQYPAAYTEIDRELLRSSCVYGYAENTWAEHPLGRPVMYQTFNPWKPYLGITQGLPCWAGRIGIIVDEDGLIRACNSPNAVDNQGVMGHLGDAEKLNLLTEPVICRLDHCACVSNSRYLAVDPTTSNEGN